MLSASYAAFLAVACGGQVNEGGHNGDPVEVGAPAPSKGSETPARSGGIVAMPTGTGGAGVVMPAVPAAPSTDGGAADEDAGASGSEGTLRNFMLAQQTYNGSLIGARWVNDTQELRVSLIDPETGALEDVGSLGDSNGGWGWLTLDPGTNTVYFPGKDAAERPWLNSLVLDTGERRAIPFRSETPVANVTEGGRLIAAYWDGSAERVILVDPETGDETEVGTLGSLEWWGAQMMYDRETHSVYAVGRPGMNAPERLYTLSLDTGACTEASLDRPNYAIARSAHGGRLLAAYWTGSEEHVVYIDPSTGESTSTVGVLGDLQTWTGDLVNDVHASAAYAIGQDVSDTSRVYTMDLTR